jgi:hypothetical protein
MQIGASFSFFVQDSSLLESEREFDIDMQLADAKKRPS